MGMRSLSGFHDVLEGFFDCERGGIAASEIDAL